jgi:hypothetical protein
MKAIFFLVVGILMIVGAVIWANGVRQFVRDAARAPGIVSALRAGGSHPTVTFTTANKEILSYPQNGLIFGYRVGDRVTVLYRPENPRLTASVEAIGALWFFPIMIFAMGIVFAIGGLCDTLLLRKALP